MGTVINPTNVCSKYLQFVYNMAEYFPGEIMSFGVSPVNYSDSDMLFPGKQRPKILLSSVGCNLGVLTCSPKTVFVFLNKC